MSDDAEDAYEDAMNELCVCGEPGIAHLPRGICPNRNGMFEKDET